MPDRRSSGGALRPTRRSFLIAAGGTLALGVGFLLWPRDWRGQWPAAEGEHALSGWVRIGPGERITITLPQAELGQGIWTGLAAVLAEQLHAPWERIAVEPAPLHPLFAHAELAALGTADLPPLLRELGAAAGATLIRRLNLQVTGGSASMRGYHDTVAQAGALAHALLAEGAARVLGVGAETLEPGPASFIANGRRIGFGEAAAALDVDRDLARAERRVGRAPRATPSAVPRPRLDLPPKVDGTARYAADVRLPGMVFAAIRHGQPMDGRRALLVEVGAPPDVRVVQGADWVAAIGETSMAAIRALERVEARFESPGLAPGPWYYDELDRLLPTARRVAGSRDPIVDSDEEGAILARYRMPFVAHAAMEPMAATARVEAGRAEVWAPTQAPTLARRAAARALDLSPASVIVHPTPAGGSFGRKLEADHIVEAVLIARAIGRPVQLQWSREEDMVAGVYRPPAVAEVRIRLDRRGRMAAFDSRFATPAVGPVVLARNLEGVPGIDQGSGRASLGPLDGGWPLAYDVETARLAHVAAPSPLPLGYWRSGGHALTAFAHECAVDEAALAAGRDPLRFRLDHLEGRPRHAACLVAAARAIGWGGAPERGLGRGLALHAGFDSVVALGVEAGIDSEGPRVRRVVAAVDCGRAMVPDLVRQQLEGGILFGLSAALWGGTGFTDGLPDVRDFDRWPQFTLAITPEIDVLLLDGPEAVGGVGELGVPPAAPALANALAAATGQRARAQPFVGFYA